MNNKKRKIGRAIKTPVTATEICMIALNIVNQRYPAQSLNEEELQVAFIEALPKAYELIGIAEEFLEH